VTLYGVDLSNNNWGGAPPASIIPALTAIASEGYAWIEHKVTQGATYRDAYWPTFKSWAVQKDVPHIGYHFITPESAQAQADNFAAAGGETPAMLDFEMVDRQGNPALTADIFWNVVNAFNRNNIEIMLSYYPQWYWGRIGSPDLTGVPGLIASGFVDGTGPASSLYPGDQATGWNAYGGTDPVLLQFTETAEVAWYSNVDANAFRGSLTGLRTLLT
jgi:lysozyme